MKTLKIFQILSLIIATVLCSCSNDENLGQDTEDKVYTVSLKFNGEITSSDSPLTRGTATDDLYGVLVWQDGKSYASGLYDNIEDIKINLKASSKYKFVVTAVKNGKSIIYRPFDTFYDQPFNLHCQNGLSSGFPNYGYDNFKGGTSQVSNASALYYPEADRFYGEIDNYTPTENGVINMDLKRTAFGLQYQVSGVTDGTLSVTIKNTKQTFFSKTDINSDYTSEEKIITFYDVYSAWQYADSYTENVTVSVKRNKMNIIHIKLSTDESGNNIGINVESDSDMNDESVNIPL